MRYATLATTLLSAGCSGPTWQSRYVPPSEPVVLCGCGSLRPDPPAPKRVVVVAPPERETPRPDLTRACRLGNGEACFALAVNAVDPYVRRVRLGQACMLGSGPACILVTTGKPGRDERRKFGSCRRAPRIPEYPL